MSRKKKKSPNSSFYTPLGQTPYDQALFDQITSQIIDKSGADGLPKNHPWWDSEFLCPACKDVGCSICEPEETKDDN